MIPDNDWYGHKLALAHFCGLQHPEPVFGSVMHGWRADMSPGEGHRRITSAPLFVWNERLLTQAHGFGVKNVKSFGAPFLYGVQNLFPDGPPEGSQRRGTLVFPSHSADNNQRDLFARELIDSVEQDFTPPFTVSMYYQDIEKPHTAIFRNADWRIVSFGSRADPMFLYRMISEMVRHTAMVADVPQTGVWYAAALGLHVTVVRDACWNTSDKVDSHLVDRWPDLTGGLVGPPAIEMADYELGRSFMRSPLELQDLLGWTSPIKRNLARGLGGVIDLQRGKSVRSGFIPTT